MIPKELSHQLRTAERLDSSKVYMNFEAWLLKRLSLKPTTVEAYIGALRGRTLSMFASDAGLNGKLWLISSEVAPLIRTG